MIKARMRAGASWSDALILNLSSRGMLVRSDRSPDRGSYLEIRRGAHVVVARVVWSSSGRFGVQTQDPVPAESLIRDPDSAPALAARANGIQERRAAPRTPEKRHEASRHKARAMEFAAIVIGCGSIALLIGGLVSDMVSAPLGAAQAALAAN